MRLEFANEMCTFWSSIFRDKRNLTSSHICDFWTLVHNCHYKRIGCLPNNLLKQKYCHSKRLIYIQWYFTRHSFERMSSRFFFYKHKKLETQAEVIWLSDKARLPTSSWKLPSAFVSLKGSFHKRFIYWFAKQSDREEERETERERSFSASLTNGHNSWS